MKNPNISCRSHWNPSDKTASLFNKEEMLLFLISLCFHALCRANLISTAARLLCMKGLGMYQCPQSGDPLFYRIQIPIFWFVSSRVNALNRANLISNVMKSYLWQRTFRCVNALNRANLISTLRTLTITRQKRRMCQCPPSGDPHFYPALSEPAVLAVLRARFCM